MPKIDLHGQLIISSELFSRLKDRGLITADLQCTDNFLAYIQECLARDDVKVPYSAIMPGNSFEKALSAGCASDDTNIEAQQEQLVNNDTNSCENPISASQVKSRLSVLYNRG